MTAFVEWLKLKEVTDSPMDRLASYCNWAVKEFKFDGFHLDKSSSPINHYDNSVHVRFYREKDKPAYGTLQIRGDDSTYASTTPLAFAKPVDRPIEDIVKFFNDAGYECKASLNSIGGVSVEMKIS